MGKAAALKSSDADRMTASRKWLYDDLGCCSARRSIGHLVMTWWWIEDHLAWRMNRDSVAAFRLICVDVRIACISGKIGPWKIRWTWNKHAVRPGHFQCRPVGNSRTMIFNLTWAFSVDQPQKKLLPVSIGPSNLFTFLPKGLKFSQFINAASLSF